ncbi:hypothetical protein BDN71DRAFT_1443875 [Pleurotus eryngii]|uniref:BRCT domain-containing protein n=1 Tax=Pleurotus eryngii TaxID=5323 RepID=A0A9P6DB35_PLEER|nr:hypothetical protein BDN71DRAFT_1443875 [Pleurotus eryngii]
MLFGGKKACFSPSVPPNIRKAWIRGGGAIVRTHEEFYEADFFICNALDDPWVQKLMRQSKVVLHAEWVLQSVDAYLLVGVAPYVLDDFFCERNMSRQASHRQASHHSNPERDIPPEVTTVELEVAEEPSHSKKRGHDIADLSAIDIIMRPSKRPRIQFDEPIVKLAQDPKMNDNAASLRKADTAENVITRPRGPPPVLNFHDHDLIYERDVHSPSTMTKKGANEKAIQGVKTVTPSHTPGGSEQSQSTTHVNVKLRLSSKQKSERSRPRELDRTFKDSPKPTIQTDNDASDVRSTRPSPNTTTSTVSSRTTENDERAPAFSIDSKNNPLSFITFRRKSKFPVLRFIPHSCACSDRSQTPLCSQEETGRESTKDDSPTSTFRHKLQKLIEHQPEETPRFSVKALCNSYPRVDSAIFRPGTEHGGKKFRVK